MAFIHRKFDSQALRLGKLCMMSTKVLCAATSELGNSSNYYILSFTQLCVCTLVTLSQVHYTIQWVVPEAVTTV